MGPQPKASRLRDSRRLRLAAAGTVVVLVAVLTAQAMPGAPSPGSSAQPSASGAVTPTSAPGDSVPGESAATWSRLVLGADQPLAELSAVRADASGVARSSGFVLRSKSATPAVALARGLTASPTLDFRVTAGATADLATLQPVSPLTAGKRYRLSLAAPDGSLAGTWTFRVAGPLHVAGLLPRNRTTGVPVRTGIEVTFDQDSPIDFQSHFSIKPEVAGRFEVHDRTWVFVPSKPLQPGTLYTYTVRAGVGMKDSSQRLEANVSASFETESAGTLDPQVRFDRTVFDVRTGTAPLLGLLIWDSNAKGEPAGPAPTSLRTQVYRLPSIVAAASAASRLSSYDDWLRDSSAGLVPTDGLTRVGSFDARLTDHVDFSYVMHLPTALDAGTYLVVVPRNGRDAQAVVQVTNVAAYGLSSNTRTIVWLNDLATGNPVVNATVSVPGGPALGVTNADGLLNAATPDSMLTSGDAYFESHARVLTVRTLDGRTSLVPLGAMSGGHYSYNDPYARSAPSPWWTVFSTDRGQYRATDTIHAWGFVRTRDGQAVPGRLAVRLLTGDGSTASPIATAAVAPTTRGTFVVDVPIRDLPIASYQLELVAGTEVVATAWIEVTLIRKPALSIDVQTDHPAYIAGDTIHVTATAAFFDGTTSPGLDLNFGTWNYGNNSLAIAGHDTTDDRGEASSSLPAKVESSEGYSYSPITVVPVRPEEGEVKTEASVYVFPSSVWLTGSSVIRDGRLRLSGTASRVDIPTVERALGLTGNLPNGAMGPGLVGQALTIQVTHVIQVRTLLRTEYDYVEKKTVPVYRYEERREGLGTWNVTSGASGAYSLSIALREPRDSYEVTVQARDSKSRLVKLTTWVFGPYGYDSQRTPLSMDGPSEARVGQVVDLTVRNIDQATPAGRYLWIVGQDGIRSIVVRQDGTFRRTFGARDLPDLTVRAVHLTGNGVEVVGDHSIALAPTEKVVHVTLTPDRARYQPGDAVTVAIRTTDEDGTPIAADVVVRAVDQKLYAMGAASDPDTRAALMALVGSGFLQSYGSEFAPRASGDYGGGMGGAGGGREDFRDWLTFQLVATGADGRGSVSFRLSDDLTSWHVSASAFSATLDSGDGAAIIPVGLPFFVDATLAPSYLAGERPVLRVRAYGEGLRPGDPVRFVISAPTLGIARTLDGTAFQAVRLPLPALPGGDVQVTIDGQRVGNDALRDRLVRTVHVVPNRLTMLRTTYQDLGPTTTPTTGVGLTTYLVTDAGRGSLIPLLQELAQAGGARFDRLAAAEAARALLASTFELPLSDLQPTGFDPTRYQNNDGLALLPYSSADLSLAAEAALVVRDQIDASALRSTLHWFLDPAREAEKAPTREEAILAEVALAALGDDVLDKLHVLETSSSTATPLTTIDRLWLALGYLASGDEAAARAIERDVLSTFGLESGPWVRLDVTLRPDVTNGLMLLLAGSLGDPIASKLARYLTDNPSSERAYALEQLGYARGMLDRLARSAGSFAWTVDGQRHVETLEAGGSFRITLTPAQQRTLSFERLAGALLVTTDAVTSATSSDLPSDTRVTIRRTVDPASDASETGLVRVTLTVSAPRLGPGCYTVTDVAPSGLAPVASAQTWPDDTGFAGGRTLWPYRVEGQRLSWCYDPAHPNTLTYVARVVTPGTYTWEPALAQYDLDSSVGAHTATTTYTIR